MMKPSEIEVGDVLLEDDDAEREILIIHIEDVDELRRQVWWVNLTPGEINCRVGFSNGPWLVSDSWGVRWTKKKAPK